MRGRGGREGRGGRRGKERRANDRKERGREGGKRNRRERRVEERRREGNKKMTFGETSLKLYSSTVIRYRGFINYLRYSKHGTSEEIFSG